MKTSQQLRRRVEVEARSQERRIEEEPQNPAENPADAFFFNSVMMKCYPWSHTSAFIHHHMIVMVILFVLFRFSLHAAHGTAQRGLPPNHSSSQLGAVMPDEALSGSVVIEEDGLVHTINPGWAGGTKFPSKRKDELVPKWPQTDGPLGMCARSQPT